VEHRIVEATGLGRPFRRIGRRRTAALIAATLGLLLASCTSDEVAGLSASPTPAASALGRQTDSGQGGGDRPQYGGVYRYHNAGSPDGQDPITVLGPAYSGTWGRALSSLLRYAVSPDLDSGSYVLATDLAVDWENPEPTVYVLRLRQGVVWQDLPPVNGREFVAADAVFSVNRLAGESSVQRNAWRTLERVEALDSHTLKFTLKAPSADFLSTLALEASKMMAPEAVEAGGGHLEGGPTIGTGAWRVECDEIEYNFSSNPDYHLKDGAGNPLPYLRRINTIVMACPQ
jgi:peptide/nickel transport system substrate-binding protein